MKKILWEELRRPEFEQAVKDDAIIILPTGSTEQHGDHLPVNTDVNIPFSLAKCAAEAIDDFPVLVLPAIWTGYSPMHMTHPGTITLKYHTLVEMLSQIAESVYAHGFKKIIYLNGHGGNISAVGAMRFKLAYEAHCPPPVVLGYWQLPSQAKFPDVYDHAGEFETSFQLYLQPELVDTDSLVWSEGVFGDPSKGTLEKGEGWFKDLVDDFARMLREYHEDKLDDGWGWSEQPMVGKKDVHGTKMP